MPNIPRFGTWLAFALVSLALAAPASAQTTSFSANTLVIPMDTTYQDNGVFLAFGLMDDLLKKGIPVHWAILPQKSYADTDFTATNMLDLYSGSTITTANYAGGPFVIDSENYALALPIVQRWQAKYNTGSNVLAVHQATQTFLAPIGRTMLAAPSLALFVDGNEDIAFSYLNAAAIYQPIPETTARGSVVMVNTTASVKPTVSTAPAGNSTVSGTCTEADGTVISVFVNGLYAGDTTVAAGAWSYGPTAIPGSINVTATATAAGKATSQLSKNRGSGNLPAGGTSAAPVVGAYSPPLRQGDSTIYGTSSEADGTTIKLFKNGVLNGMTTVTSGNWKYIPATPAVGGDTWNATAVAPSKTESALSNFVIAVPVPATITNTDYAPGATTIKGALLMTTGTVVSVYRTRSSLNTLIGTAALNNGTWQVAVANTVLVAGDQIWATSAAYPYPAGSGTYTCPGTACCADCLSAAAIDGPTTTNHADGMLLDGSGNPRYCQIMSMHYTASGHDPEVVAEVRSFLQFQTNAFFECQAVNAFEDDAASGHFLSTNGLVAETPASTSYYFNQDIPFAQATGPFKNAGGSERAYTLAAGSTYYNSNVVHLSAQPGTTYPLHGHQDEWMSGHIGGDTSKGKVSYLGGHLYTTALPLSTNGKSQGVRYFLNSLFEAPCASEAVSNMTLWLSGPGYNNGGNSTYTISYTTTGSTILQNVVINMPLLTGITYVSSTGGGTLIGSTISWNLGNIAAGSNGSVQFTVSFSTDGSCNFHADSSWLSSSTPLAAQSNTVTTICDTVPPAPPVVVTPANNSSSTNTMPAVTGTAEAHSTVKVYIDEILYGTVTADGSGNWSYPVTSGQALALGAHTVHATATDATGNVSAASATNNFSVLSPSTPPIVTTPLLAGSSQTIYGSSVEAVGTSITAYKNGVSIGTTTVQDDGTWTLTDVSLSSGDTIYATALASGKGDSGPSNVVTVSANPGGVTPAPVVTAPIASLATSVSGMSVANATVDVCADGVYLGTTTADSSGAWTLSGVPSLANGAVVDATATVSPTGTSNWSAPVIVGTMVNMLRSDLITAISQPIAPCFTRPWAPSPNSMDHLGAKHRSSWGEGPSPQPSAPGSLDGDAAYIYNVTSGSTDPDSTVLTDNGRPLVFYELLDNNANTLKLHVSDGNIVFTITP